MTSGFMIRFNTLVQDKAYEALRNWLAVDEGIAFIFIGLKLINKMPDNIEIPFTAFYFILFSIVIAIVPLLFFLRPTLTYGYYLIAIRMAAISTFFLIYGFVAIIPDSFQYKYIILAFVWLFILFTLFWSILEIRNNFYLNKGFGWYVLGINVVSYALILPIPLLWIV